MKNGEQAISLDPIKKRLREQSKQALLSQEKAHIEALSIDVSKQVAKFFQKKSIAHKNWAAFIPYKNEVSLNYNNFFNINFVYPFASSKDSMEFYNLNNEQKANYDFYQKPVKAEVFDKSAIEGFLIPGLAFDRKGGRLGRGKAYYDRYLKNTNKLKVGITFDFLMTNEALPMEAFDVKMDYIITNKEIVEVN